MTGCWRRDSAAVTAGVAFLALVFAPPGHALDDCGVGMFYNNANGQCEPWAPAGVDFAPAVPVPVFNPVPIGIGFDPLPIGIGFDRASASTSRISPPYLRVPGIPGIPGIHVPGVPVPNIHVPDVRVPDAGS